MFPKRKIRSSGEKIKVEKGGLELREILREKGRVANNVINRKGKGGSYRTKTAGAVKVSSDEEPGA